MKPIKIDFVDKCVRLNNYVVMDLNLADVRILLLGGL